MKSLKYIWRNVKRNRLRTLLTVLSVGFSLALMTILHGYMAMQSVWGKEATKTNRVVVMNVQGFAGLLPIAMVDEVRGVDGVTAAVPFAWYGGNYEAEQMPFAQFATDASQAFNVWDEYKISPAELNAWQSDPQGCVADRQLAEKRKWKIGDRIRLQGTYYKYDLDLKLVGLYDTEVYSDSVWFHWKYLNEGLKTVNGRAVDRCGTIFAKVKESSMIPTVVKKIDESTASSADPTRTLTEAAFAQMFADMLGNIQVFIRNIGIAVVFSLALVAGNAMAMSMRERTTEVAVLKAIGFPRMRVLSYILGESCLITLLGGLIGLGLGCLFLQTLHSINSQYFPFGMTDLAGMWMAVIVLIAVGIGVASGIVPAIRAAQLSVVDGLRRVI